MCPQHGEGAGEATVNYIARFGRLPWPERRALAKLNINADALYIERADAQSESVTVPVAQYPPDEITSGTSPEGCYWNRCT